MTDRTHPDSGRTTGGIVEMLQDRIAELEAQLEAIGAGGVSGPLMGQPQAPLGGRWYMVNRDGMATLCTDREDAEKEAADAQSVWPHMGPHRAVQLVEASFDAADMATASAQGFRDGVASVAASAGNEPVAVAEVSCTHVHGWGTRWIVDADRKLNIPPLGTKLYARPPAPKQGQKDSSRLRKALIRAQQAINSMKVEAETAAQGDKRMMLEACETISNEGLQADMAIRDVLANHPSPPEVMVGGWRPIEAAPKDGTRILLHPAVEVHDSWSKGHWSEQQECWIVGGAASGVTHTYWLPLPPSPSSADEGGSR